MAASAIALRPLNISALTKEQKVEEAMLRGSRLLGEGVAQQFKSFFTPVNMSITVGTLVAWAVAHLYGVGEAFDLLALVVGVGFVGWGFWDGFKKLISFAVTAVQANSEQDLNAAALLFRDAVIELGINTLLTLLLKKPVGEALSKPGRITQINLRPGLAPVPRPPAGPGATVEFVGPAELPTKAAASTDAYGNIKILKYQSIRDQMKSQWHEEVHSALSPKSALLRQFRAQVHESLYQRSVFLRYLEEAAAETRSLIKETQAFEGGSGLTKKNFITGMRFPLADERYAILARVPKTQIPIVGADIATQGRLLGSIIVEGHFYNAYIAHKNHTNAQPQPK